MKLDLTRYREVRVADARSDQLSASAIAGAESSSVTQEDYQQFLISQVKRILHGDRAGHWRDDFEALGFSSLQDLYYDLLLEVDPVGTGVTYAPTYSGLQLATESWVATATTTRIKLCTYTYGGLFAQTAVRQVFDPTGSTVAAQTTTTFTWSGGRLVGSTTTRDV